MTKIKIAFRGNLAILFVFIHNEERGHGGKKQMSVSLVYVGQSEEQPDDMNKIRQMVLAFLPASVRLRKNRFFASEGNVCIETVRRALNDALEKLACEGDCYSIDDFNLEEA